jgi:hypothetical protein
VELGREQPVGALGLPGRELRHVAIDRAEMNAEMRGVQGTPAARRIDLCLGARGEEEENNRQCGVRNAECGV